MRKGSELIGKPVVAFDTGQQIEHIRDLLFDQTNNQLLGFLVDEGGCFSSARVLPLQNVQSLGQDALIVPSPAAVINAAEAPAISRLLERNNVLKGTKIMTTDGRDLGTMTDLYFDERTGAVEGYEVSGGVFADAYTGRAFVPAPATLKIGQDVAFVPPETAGMMEEQVGGIKAAMQEVGDRQQDTSHNQAASGASRFADRAEQKVQLLGRTVANDVAAPDGTLLVAQGQTVTPLAAEEAARQGVLDQLARATGAHSTAAVSSAGRNTAPQDGLEQAQGRRVQHAVRTDHGVIIAAPSQIVTEQVLNRARTYHKEAELLDAVGLAPANTAHSQAKSPPDSVGEQLSASTQQVQHSASNLWERLKEKVNDLNERTAQEAHEARIKSALGRPVSRVILDPQDTVILNVGELITHQAITRAEQAGVLDILLGSVYDKDPEIAREELRAPEPGEASLEQRERNASL